MFIHTLEQEMIFIEFIGTVLKNRYCILEQIGKGGSARVYLARDIELGVLRAVKELPLSGKREARFLASLEHHALPQMIDYEEEGEKCYIIMEYVKGQTLGGALRGGRKFTIKEVADFGYSLAQVLGYLHSRKPPVFYGDLKPDNLMLSERGKLYLIDFGSAVTGYEKTQRVCMGTRGFAAPEQYEGRMSEASDIYSLGKTLAVLLGKRIIFLPFLFPGFAAVLMRCCCKEEKLRYQRAEILEKKFCKLQTGKRGVRIGIAVGGLASAALILMLAAAAFSGKEPDFYDRITEVTDLYYIPERKDGQPEEKARLCKEAERLLQELLRQYHGKREYRILMRMLAWNREYAGDETQAAYYYEQILQYDGGYREAYGEYGMFLLRAGQEDACRELWKTYLQKEDGLEEGESWNLLIWEKEMRARKNPEVKKGAENER